MSDAMNEHTKNVGLGEGAPGARTGGNDFALTIGIDHYPRFRSLRGAVNDARAFHAWLTSAEGGGIDPANGRATLIESVSDPARPIQDEIDDALVSLFERADAEGGGRRLYFYFSGHGAWAQENVSDDTALLLARWSRVRSRVALSQHHYAGQLVASRMFDEVVILLDCCRSPDARAIGVQPTMTYDRNSLPRRTGTWIAHATGLGDSARERLVDGAWSGDFTRCLLAILRSEQGGIDAALLRDRVEAEVTLATGGQQPDVKNGLTKGAWFGRKVTDGER